MENVNSNQIETGDITPRTVLSVPLSVHVLDVLAKVIPLTTLDTPEEVLRELAGSVGWRDHDDVDGRERLTASGFRLVVRVERTGGNLGGPRLDERDIKDEAA